MDYFPKKLINLLEQKGYLLLRMTGSYPIYFNKDNKKTIAFPFHGNKDISKETFMSILWQARIPKDEV